LAEAALTNASEGEAPVEGAVAVPAHASRKKGTNSMMKNLDTRWTMDAS
jgi:hypothetical protein